MKAMGFAAVPMPAIPSRLEHAGRLGHHPLQVVDVLQDVATVDEIERGVAEGQGFADAHVVVDLQSDLRGVPPCRLRRGRRGVDAGDS
jgi:hypothetical protein